MTWNKDFWNMTTHPYIHLSEKDTFEIPAPPTNESEETRKELDHLLALQALRTPEKIAEIKSQLKLEDFKYDCFQIKDLIDTKQKYLPELISMFSLDVISVMMRVKRKYDRVRPIYLEKGLTTVIPTPGHPAYPSGHATETYLFARLFSEFNPAKEEIYFHTAKSISQNRELAGVHYPSDTKAGQVLSEQIFVAFKKNPKFNKLAKKAGVEFNRNFSCK